MKTNQEIFNEFCDKHEFCSTCGFSEHDSCAWDRDENLRYSIEVLMSMVREDCEPNDWLKGLRPSHNAFLDFELEEELGKE